MKVLKEVLFLFVVVFCIGQLSYFFNKKEVVSETTFIVLVKNAQYNLNGLNLVRRSTSDKETVKKIDSLKNVYRDNTDEYITFFKKNGFDSSLKLINTYIDSLK